MSELSQVPLFRNCRRLLCRECYREINRFLADHVDTDKFEFQVYPTGSFINGVTTETSDLDVLVVLTSHSWVSCDHRIIDEDGKLAPVGTYLAWRQFRSMVLKRAKEAFGSDAVTDADKSIEIDSSRLPVPIDIVVTTAYWYASTTITSSSTPDYGISLWASNGEEMVNMPFQHVRSGLVKNAETFSQYQRTVSDLKRLRDAMDDRGVLDRRDVPGYFLEHACRAVPNEVFNSTDPTLESVVRYLLSVKPETLTTVGDHLPMFGTRVQQWRREQYYRFLVETVRTLVGDETPEPATLLAMGSDITSTN